MCRILPVTTVASPRMLVVVLKARSPKAIADRGYCFDSEIKFSVFTSLDAKNEYPQSTGDRRLEPNFVLTRPAKKTLSQCGCSISATKAKNFRWEDARRTKPDDLTAIRFTIAWM